MTAMEELKVVDRFLRKVGDRMEIGQLKGEKPMLGVCLLQEREVMAEACEEKPVRKPKHD